MTPLPPTFSLMMNPRLSRWIALPPDGTVRLSVGKVEIGQGILTALAQIAADELDVDLSRVRLAPAETTASPNEMFTAGSTSIEQSGMAVRQVAAEVRQLLVEEAARRLEVSPSQLVTRDATVVAEDGRALAYSELAGDGLLDRDATGEVEPKGPEERRWVGTSAARTDLPAKVVGGACFVHDLVFPRMLHGRLVRPPAPGARLLSVDDAETKAAPGVCGIVRDGSFLGVLAEREELAVQASEHLAAAAEWSPGWELPDADDLGAFLRAGPHETTTIGERTAEDPLPAASRSVSASYSRPFLAHASMGPSCAVARWDEDRLEIWCSGQGIVNLRGAIARGLGCAPEAVLVHHVEGPGGYGHNGADDVAFEAALLARTVPGRPVRLLWSREEELAWSPFGASGTVELLALLDASGGVVEWKHHVWSNGHISRPGVLDDAPAFLVAPQLEKPFERVVAYDIHPDNGSGRNAAPYYGFPAFEVVGHRLLEMPLRTSSLRSLGAFLNVFAIESFMDELADATGADPAEFRLRHLDDPRARAVLEAAWKVRDACPKGDGLGRGLAFARYKNVGGYCAVVAEVEAGKTLRARRLAIVADVGAVINPDGVVNQLEGGAIQAASWTLREQVRFDRERVTSTTWETYPILRFSEVPEVEVRLITDPADPPLGVGEIVQGPVAAAIANGLADALGLRVRDLPLTRERIVSAMEDR